MRSVILCFGLLSAISSNINAVDDHNSLTPKKSKFSKKSFGKGVAHGAKYFAKSTAKQVGHGVGLTAGGTFTGTVMGSDYGGRALGLFGPLGSLAGGGVGASIGAAAGTAVAAAQVPYRGVKIAKHGIHAVRSGYKYGKAHKKGDTETMSVIKNADKKRLAHGKWTAEGAAKIFGSG